MQGDLVVVFGGSGFIGRHLIRTLAKRGKRIRVPMRRPHLGVDLRVSGDVGQVQLSQANLRFPESVDRALEDADAVVNLVGLLSERGTQTFTGVQAGGARIIAEAAAKRGITRFVQVSAIGADLRSRSAYGRTKAEAEAAVRKSVPTATILRPSIVFGAEDGFLNRFAAMARSAPALPLIGGGKTRFQPVYVQNVADAIAAALDRPDAQGRTFELGGPSTYTFKQILQFIMAETQRPRPLAPLPFGLAGLIGGAFGLAAKLLPVFEPPLTGDQVEMLKRDNVVGASGEAGLGTIADLGIGPLETIEAIAPSYLWKYRPYGQFETKPGDPAKKG